MPEKNAAGHNGLILALLVLAFAGGMLNRGALAASVFNPINIRIVVPPSSLQVNLTVPATDPVTGNVVNQSQSISIPIQAVMFNVTLPANFSEGIYTALNLSINRTVLQSAISSSLNSSLQSATTGASSSQNATNFTKNAVGPISDAVAASLASSIPIGVASAVPNATALALGTTLSSSLSTGLPTVLSQSLSESLAYVIPNVSSSGAAFASSLFAESNGGASGVPLTQQQMISEEASYVSTAFKDNLTTVMTPIFEKKLSSLLYSDLEQGLPNSLYTDMQGEGLNNTLYQEINSSMAAASAGTGSGRINASISRRIAVELSQQLSANLASDISKQLSISLSQEISQDLGTGISTYTAEEISSEVNTSLQNTLPGQFVVTSNVAQASGQGVQSVNQGGQIISNGGSGSYSYGFLNFGANLGSVPVQGVPAVFSDGNYISVGMSVQYLTPGQLGYTLLQDMPGSVSGQTSAIVGTALTVASQGLTPYSTYQAIQQTLPIVLPNAMASSVSYALGQELNGGMSLSDVVSSVGIATGNPYAYQASGVLNSIQSGGNVGSALEEIGMLTGSQTTVAAGSLLNGYQEGESLPGLVAQMGYATGSQSLTDAGILLGEWQANASVGTLASTIGVLTGSQGLAESGQVLNILQQPGSYGNLITSVGMVTGSPDVVKAGLVLSALQNNQSLGNLLGIAGYVSGSTNVEKAGYALSILQNGGSLGQIATSIGAISGSTQLVDAGEVLSALQTGGTLGSAVTAAGQLSGSQDLTDAGYILSAVGNGGGVGSAAIALGEVTNSQYITGAGIFLSAVQNGGTVPGLLNNLASSYGSPYLYGAAAAAGLLAHNGSVGALLDLQAAGSSGYPASALYTIGTVPGGITATASIPGGQLLPSNIGLNGGYFTSIGGVLPVSVLGSVNFVLPNLPSSAVSLSNLFPGLSDIGVPSSVTNFLNQEIPGIPNMQGLDPYLKGLNIPGVSGLNIPGLQGLGLSEFPGLNIPGLQSILGNIPSMQGLLGDLGLSGLSLPSIPGLSLSGFSIPGLGTIPTGFNFGVGGSYGILAGKLGVSVGINGVQLETNLKVDLSNSFSELGVSSGVVNDLGEAAGYVSLALQAYSVIQNLGSSAITVPIPIVIVNTPFPVNQTGGVVVVPQNTTSGGGVSGNNQNLVTEAVFPFHGTAPTVRHSLPEFASAAGLTSAQQCSELNNQFTAVVATVSNGQCCVSSGGQQTCEPLGSLSGNGGTGPVVGASGGTPNPQVTSIAGAGTGVSSGTGQQASQISTQFNLIPQQQTVVVSSAYVVSPAGSVGQYNAKNALWFLTCPTAPPTANPTNDILFFANKGLSVAGDACLAEGGTLKTLASLSASVHTMSPCGAALQLAPFMIACDDASILPLKLVNPGVLTAQVISYSPTVDGQLSNGFSTNSYIFQSVPSSAQHAIWTWNAEVANFGLAAPQEGTFSKGGLVVISAPGCTYLYSYSEKTELTSLQNNYIPFFEVVSPNGAPAASFDTPPPGSSGSVLKTTQINSNVIPLLYYNYSLGVDSPVTGFNPNISGISEDTYSPWNYYTPSNNIDQFPIDIPGVFLSANSNEILGALPSNGLGIDVNGQFSQVMGFENSLNPVQSFQNSGGLTSNGCPSGGVLTKAEAISCASNAGFTGTALDTVVAIAEAESSLNSAAVNNNGGLICGSGAGVNAGTPQMAVGILQILTCAHPTLVTCTGETANTCSGCALSPQCAFNAAYTDPTLTAGGTSFGPWVTYNTGAYCTYLPSSDPCIKGGSGGGLVASNLGGTNSYLPYVNSYSISNPISISSPGNDYVYVLFPVPNQQNNYDIAVIRVFPKGYYNATNVPLPPIGNSNADCSSGGGCDAQWIATWKNYWNSVIDVQSNQAYVVKVIPLTNLYDSAAGVNGPIGPQQETPYTASAGGTTGASCTPTAVGQSVLGQCSSINPGIVNGYGGVGNLCQPSGQCQIASSGSSNCPAGETTWECTAAPSGNSGTASIQINDPTLSFGQYTNIAGSCSSACTLSSNLPGFTEQSSVAGQINYVYTVQNNAKPGQYTVTVTNAAGTSVSGVVTINAGACANIGGTCAFTPYNISADLSGDIYVVGSGNSPTGNNYAEIVKVSNVIVNGRLCSGQSSICDAVSFGSVEIPGTSTPPAFTEIAAAPELGNVYIASPNADEINVFSGQTLNYLDSIPLTFGIQYPAPGGKQLLHGPTLNIAYWLANGGLFNYKIPVSYQQSISGSSGNADLDQASNHHPLALSDINGYLYVLDNWAGTLQSGTKFNILMLREINSTGADVPINPSTINDVFAMNSCVTANLNTNECYQNGAAPQANACGNSCIPVANPSEVCGSSTAVAAGDFGSFYTPSGYKYTCASNSFTLSNNYYSLASSDTFQKNIYPPYGWIISATVGGTSFCASGCTSTQGPYFAVGPRLSPATPCSSVFSALEGFFSGCPGGIGMSVNENGTVAILMPSSNTNFANEELLFARFNAYNYTKPEAGTPPFQCYTQAGGGVCLSYPGLSNIKTPIYSVGDPFRYLENQGSEQVLSYANQYYSEFTGGSGTLQNQEGISSSCLSQVENGLLPTNCPGGSSGSLININNELVSTLPIASVASPGTAAANVPILKSSVSGYALVGYKYTWNIKESWGPFSLIYGPWYCVYVKELPKTSYSKSGTVYSYAITPAANSVPLSANVEGGDTYIQYVSSGNYYSQNLSDIGLYLSHHIMLNLSSNREFGDAYVAYAGQTNNYQILNATRQLEYVIETFTRASQTYQAIVSTPALAVTGPQYAVNAHAPAVSGVPANFIFTNNPSQAPHFGSVVLFDWYKEETFVDPLDLYVPTISGYNRIIYALTDTFDNTIFVPIDADMAHITNVSVNLNTALNNNNPNQSTVSVTGQAGVYSYNGFDVANSFFVPLSGAQIYIYFSPDMNYLGQGGAPLSVQDAQLCAFGSSSSPYLKTQYPSTCQLANPMWQGLQAGANKVTYAPDYTSAGTCGPPPNSLLQTQPLSCNIYGAYSLPTTCQSSGSRQAYCYPIYENGSGTCTSQIGLAGIVTTNAIGGYSLSENACGIGQISVTASYYGDSLQPISVTQPPLTSSANVLLGIDPPLVTFPGVGYQWAPNKGIQLGEIGLFELGFGNVEIGLAAAIAIAVLAFSFYISRKRKD